MIPSDKNENPIYSVISALCVPILRRPFWFVSTSHTATGIIRQLGRIISDGRPKKRHILVGDSQVRLHRPEVLCLE